MNILFLTSGRSVPASRFRVLQYLPHVRRSGHRFTVRPSHPPQYEYWPWLGWRPSQRLRRVLRYVDLQTARWRKFDVVYVERELFDDNTWDMEERFRRLCRRLVLDVDDALFLRHPDKFFRLAELADIVIAGNTRLAHRVRPVQNRIAIVPTVVDLDRYALKPVPPSGVRPVIGWTGTSGGFAYLQLIAGALCELARRRSFELRIIADRFDRSLRDALSGVDVRFVPWRAATEIRDLHAFDIGLMPLADDEWSQHKCALKIVQYMAIGIPAVASPVGANQEIIREWNNGVLADSPEQWVSSLTSLIDDEPMRRRLGLAGRQTVEQQYSVQAQFARWLNAVEGR